jgi:hypothetical protein
MANRAAELHATADQQVSQLIELLSERSEAQLREPCPGREKLGDGTFAAALHHVADNYERIASFVKTSEQMSRGHATPGAGRHGVPRFLRAFGHRPPDHVAHDAGAHEGQHDAGAHERGYTAAALDRDALLSGLAATREALKLVGELTDARLATVPPDGSFRFCDGKRTLDGVLTSLLKHQAHQVAALAAAAN